ncbi:subtilisin-like protein [Coniochaeta sp. PMI_546]|nr:subtilisin-like protein [Coniochaeta sp. PMI_546]
MSTPSDKWLQRLESEAGKFLSKSRSKHQGRRVRIAILDTGIDARNVAFARPLSKALIKVEDFVTPGGDGLDLHGHGTHCVGLLCKIAPEAEIYVAKVVKDDSSPPDAGTVAKAILRAASSERGSDGVSNWNVDIIVLSLGHYKPSGRLDDALRYAHMRNKIVLAAASNNGRSSGILFPANLPTVICIHAASASGVPSSFNHPAVPGKDLAILGEDVEAAWCCGTRDKVGKKQTQYTVRTSGTSVAASIAAGVVALILEFAQQDGTRSSLSADTLYRLKSCSGMYSVLTHMSQGKGDYRNIIPWMLLKASSDANSAANIIKFAIGKCER